MKKIIKNRFVKNILIVISGTVGAQIITMLLSPLITRLYGPDAFGIMGSFQSVTNIIIPVAALTYPISIVLPKKDEEAKKLFNISVLISFFLAFLLFVNLLIFNKYIINIFNLKDLSNYLFLLPLVIVFSGVMQSLEQWLIRKEKFNLTSSATVFQSSINNVSKVGLGFIKPLTSTLVIITALNNGIKAFLMFIMLKERKSLFNFRAFSYKSMKKTAKKYYDFPLYRAPQEFVNGVTNGIPALMLLALFGPASAGFYTIGKNVLRLPSRLIGKAVGDVFYPRITKAFNEGKDTLSLLKKSTLGLMVVGAIPFGIIMIFGPVIFQFVFGEEWNVAGEYARWIALWSFSSLANRPCIKALATFNAQRFHLVFTVFMLGIRVTLLWVGYALFNSDLIAIALFGISGFILNFLLVFYTFRIAKKKVFAK